jgi:ABC-type phosphate transport system permease subunit
VLVLSTLVLALLGWQTGNSRYWQWLKKVWKAGFVVVLLLLLFFFLSRLARI